MTEDHNLAIPEPTAPIEVNATPVPASPPAAVAPVIPAGWLADPTNSALMRYWDGNAWTEHTAPAQAAAAAPPVQVVVQQSNVVGVGYGRRTNHVLHLILTLLTGGLWLPVWIIVALSNRSQRTQVASGNNFR